MPRNPAASARAMLIWLWLILLGTNLTLSGQQPSFRRFGLRDGLPQSQVSALIEDRRGFLWVGTNTGGVARLGASGFRTFSAREGMQAQIIRALLEAPDGAIWVASQEGVSEIRGDTVVNHGPGQGLAPGAAQALALDAEGRVLIATRLGVFRYEGKEFVPLPLPGTWAGRSIKRMALDRARGLWLADANDHLARWDALGLKELPLPPTHAGHGIKDVQVDPAGVAWILLEDALLKMEKGHWVEEPLPGAPANRKATSLRFDARPGGYVVALGGDGILVKEPNGQSTILNARSGLPHDRILVAIRDRRGILWVGSDGDGLAAQALPGLLSLENALGTSGREPGAIAGILELAPDRYLLASSTGLYLQVEGQGIIRRWTQRDGLPTDDIWSLFPDGQGGAWLGTDRGLARWENGRVAKAGPPEMARAAVLTMKRHQGRLLAGTDKGLFELDPRGRLLAHHRLPPETGDETVSDIVEHEGHLLLATGLGLWELADGRLAPIHTSAPFSAETVTTMTKDSLGRLWIGTMKGLHVLAGGRWSSFGTAEGLPDDGITFIAETGLGRLAIGHNKGVTLLEGRSLHHLNRNLGLISDETNHNGFLLDSKGRLWIGMIGGVNILANPGGFRNPALRAPTLLDLRWPSGTQALSTETTVPPRPDFLDLSFDTGSPLTSSPVHYEVFLQGVDEGWRPVNQGLTLQYRNLGAGRYTFHLRASTDGRTWVEGRSVSIRVRPAWHERWLVRGLAVLALIALLGWGLWLRVHTLALRSRALEETIEERTLLLARQNRALGQAHEQIKRSLEGRLRLLDTVTHDLRSPLTTILLTLDRLRELAPAGLSMLDVMEHEAHRIEALVRNLLDQSRSEALIQTLKPVPIAPAEVTEGFEEVLRLKAEACGLRFSLEVSPETERVRLRADLATLHQVMLNLFENALKFTPTGGAVGVRSFVDLPAGTWSLEVWDTGRGLDPNQIEDIFRPFHQAQSGDAAHGWGLGLSICQSILDAHQGELKVESEPGKGARFRMVLPLDSIDS